MTKDPGRAGQNLKRKEHYSQVHTPKLLFRIKIRMLNKMGKMEEEEIEAWMGREEETKRNMKEAHKSCCHRHPMAFSPLFSRALVQIKTMMASLIPRSKV